MPQMIRRFLDYSSWPLPAWVAIGLGAAALLLPWALRFYERYYAFASGRPCGTVLQFLMPRVIG